MVSVVVCSWADVTEWIFVGSLRVFCLMCEAKKGMRTLICGRMSLASLRDFILGEAAVKAACRYCVIVLCSRLLVVRWSVEMLM